MPGQVIEDVYCPLKERGCRFASVIYRESEFTRVVIDPKTHLFKPAGRGGKRIPVDVFCNNDGRKRVSELKVCPTDLALDEKKVKPFKAVKIPCRKR